MTRRIVWVCVLILLGGVLGSASFGYVIFARAKKGDVAALALSTYVAARFPEFVLRRNPLHEITKGIALAPAGWGMIGDCSYLGRQRCVAIAVDSRVGEQPLVLQTLVSELIGICDSLKKLDRRPVEKSTDSKDEARALANEYESANRVLTGYFGCAESEVRPVRIQLNVVAGLSAASKERSLPTGGKTYSSEPVKVRYQVTIERGK